MSTRTARNVQQKASPFLVIKPTKWQDQPIPERRWLVKNILAHGSITLLTGDGGLGKSLLMQQLMTGLALGGQHWVGIELPPDPIVSLGIFCEDTEDDLWRNQFAINRAYDAEMHHMEAVNLVPRVGQDNVLAFFGRDDQAAPTAFYEQVTHKIRETGAQLVVVDTAADTFGGNENYRSQVRSFINLLRRWAMEMDGGVIITAHPSNFGLSQGTGISGSTAWNNSVRSRIYLTKPKDDVDDFGEQEDTNERILKLMKNNYGPSGDQIRLRWEHGIFAPATRGGSTMMDTLALDATVEREIGKLIVDGVRVLAFDRAQRGCAKLLAGKAAVKGWSLGDIVASKERLLEKGKLVRVDLKNQYRHTETLIRPYDMRYPDEVKE